MLAEDVNIQFSGFEPSQDVKSNIDIWLNEVYRISPSRSFLEATFTLTNGLFEGVIKITSSAENFMAKATDAALPALGSKLVERLGGQLEKWKALRFD